MRVEAQHDGRRWAASDPAMLTSEVAELAAWLEVFPRVNSAPAFVEPVLRFERGDERTIRCRLWGEGLEGSGIDEDRRWERGLLLELVVTRQQTDALAEALREDLKRFPSR